MCKHPRSLNRQSGLTQSRATWALLLPSWHRTRVILAISCCLLFATTARADLTSSESVTRDAATSEPLTSESATKELWMRLEPAAKGLAIAKAADAVDDGYTDLQVELQMILRTSNGRESRRDLRIKQLEVPADGDKLLVIFDTPKAVKGTALLSYAHKRGQDDQWLFLPALKRVKKIGSRNRSGPFLSSEFSFEDLTPVEIEKYEHRFLRESACALGQCYVIERVPLDEYTGYSRQEVWLDEQHLRMTQIDFFDRRGDLMKTLKVDGYQLYQDRFWRAARMLMQNHKTGKSTELLWQGYEFVTGLDPDRDFSTQSLRRVR